MTPGRVWAHSFVMKAEHPAVVMASFVSGVILQGKPNHVNFWEDSLNASGGFHTIYARHLHVHHDDLRNEMKCHLDSGVPIGNFPYDFEGLELAEIFAKGLPEGWKIICHDNSNRCYWAGSRHKYQPYSVLKNLVILRL